MLRDPSSAVGTLRRGFNAAGGSLLRRAVWYACERLECRTLLTSVLYVDFGDNLPTGGFDLSVNQLKGDFGGGGIQGPDLTSGNTNNLAGGDNLQFTSLSGVINFDYNGDGTANAQDYTALKSAIIQLVQRYYAPFDVNVQVAPTLDTSSDANYRNAIISQLQQGANSDGERDAYVLCGTWNDTTVGQDVGNFEGLNGIAAGPDITNNNARDDSALVFASSVISGLGNTQADTALAHDVAHEAAHTFGLEHSDDGGGAGNNSLLSATDVIRVGGNQGTALTNFNTFTRFPLPKKANTAQTVNSFDRLNDPNLLGPKAGFPAYVTGTGASDIVTVTSTGAGTASVKVQAFTNGSFGTQIGGDFTYSINTANGILIETGAGNDRMVIDGSLNTTVTARGEGGTDSLVVQGNNAATGSYTPGASSVNSLDDQTDFGGTIVVGGTTINLQEIPTGGTVTVTDVGSFTYVTPNPADTVTFDTPAAGQNRVTGSSGGTIMLPLIFSKIGDFTIDTGANDGGGSTDSVVLSASSLATGLQKLSVTTGGGDDELRVDFGTGNQVPANGLFFDGGGGTGDVMRLFGGSFTNEVYTPTGGGSGTVALDSSLITYSNLAPIEDTTTATNLIFNATGAADVINIVNGSAPGGTQETQINSGNGTFERLNFANKANAVINGLAGGDTFNHSATLTAGGLATLTLNGQNTGNVGDDNAADTFNFTSTLPGIPTSAVGGGGADLFTVSGTAANPALTLAGQTGDDTFTITGSGAGGAITASGDGGGDTFNVTGLGVAAGAVNLNGEADDDTFNVSSSPDAVINVDGGPHVAGDTLNVDGESLDYTINSASFTTAGRQAVNYVNTETLGLTNGTFNVPGTIAPNVNVKTGAKLYGTGTVQGAVTTLADGVVSPGISTGSATGILNTGNVSLAGTSSYQVQVNGLSADGSQHDILNVTGTVNLGGANLDLSTGTTLIPGDEVMIVHNDGTDPIVGKFAQGDLITVGAQKFAIDYAYDGDGDGNLNDVALIRYGAALAPDPCDPTKQALFVSATTSADQIRLVGEQGNNNIHVFITTGGVTDDLGVFSPTGLLIAFGQAGDDTISVEVPSRASWLYGQDGNDVLRAGNNDSVLIGGLGDDHLVSGNGKDVLIGSQGADTLEGGNGDDLLIAGPTTFDTNTAANRSAICDIDDEWTGGTGGWKGHIDHLTRGGGKNGTTLLNSTTVFDDTSADNLLGQTGKDWFLMNRTGGGTLDSSDADNNEIVTDL